MATIRTTRAAGVLTRLLTEASPDLELADGELIRAFVERKSPVAFGELTRRHGSMVLGVCLRVLRHRQDAEDASQATFLVLARKAGSVSPPNAVGNWLHGVALQTAIRARAITMKRRTREAVVPSVPETATREAGWNDVAEVLDEELGRLPNHYRTVLLLCDVEGRTRADAARHLGCPEGSVSSRLSRAREMLARRLTKRGVTLPAGAVALLVSQNATTAGVPGALVTSTVKAVGSLAAGSLRASGISSAVTTLTDGVLKTMLLKKIMATAMVVLALSVVVIIGGSLAVGRAEGNAPPPVGPEGAGTEPIFRATAPVPKVKPKEDKEMFQGAWSIVEASAGGKHQAIEISKEQVWVFTGDGLVIYHADKSRVEMSYQIDPMQKPKAIDLSPVDEREKGYVFKGIYELDGDRLKVYYSRNVAPDAKRPKRFDPVFEDRGMRSFVLKRAPEKDALTAWGKEVGGLQAGLGLPLGAKRTYQHGETVTLVVRVRNVSKEEVEFKHIWAFFVENPPSVTDPDGKRVQFPRGAAEGAHRPRDTKVAPGKNVDLYTWEFDVRPKGERSPSNATIHGTGTFTFQCEQIVGPTSANPNHPNPKFKDFATGKLELEVKEATPGKQKILTPEEAIKMAGDSKLAREFNENKPAVEFKVQFVTKAILVKTDGKKDADWAPGHSPADVCLGTLVPSLPIKAGDPLGRNHTRFVATLTAKAIKQLNKAGINDLEKHFKGKTVRVTGPISIGHYDGFGTPPEVEIMIDDLNQFEVVK